jgi:acid phosphatase family membrane protein YuiD
MNWLLGLLSNPFLLTVVIAWISAQILKVVTHAFVYKEFDIKRLWGDGGMPSAHTATVGSLAAFAAISYGPASFEFAVCAIMALIVCRDAVGVRMETGKQAQIINELRSLIESKETIEIKLKEFVGHTPLQVLMGALLGIAVAIVVSVIL